jgi:acetylglutamate kinase
MSGALASVSPSFVVIKIGGAGVDSTAGIATLAEAIKASQKAGYSPVVVHGGGQQLTELGRRLGISSTFVAGRRVTDDQLILAAKMAFAGQVGTDLAAGLWAQGVRAVSLSGVDAGMLQVKKRPPVATPHPSGEGKQWTDYGWVGDIVTVDSSAIKALGAFGLVPLVASLGVDEVGGVFNINADTIASALAQSLSAERLVLLTDVKGVYLDKDDPTTLIPQMTTEDIQRLTASGQVSGGMLPKLGAVQAALDKGVKRVHMVSWQDGLAVEDALCARVGRGTVFEMSSAARGG